MAGKTYVCSSGVALSGRSFEGGQRTLADGRVGCIVARVFCVFRFFVVAPKGDKTDGRVTISTSKHVLEPVSVVLPLVSAVVVTWRSKSMVKWGTMSLSQHSKLCLLLQHGGEDRFMWGTKEVGAARSPRLLVRYENFGGESGLVDTRSDVDMALQLCLAFVCWPMNSRGKVAPFSHISLALLFFGTGGRCGYVTVVCGIRARPACFVTVGFAKLSVSLCDERILLASGAVRCVHDSGVCHAAF